MRNVPTFTLQGCWPYRLRSLRRLGADYASVLALQAWRGQRRPGWRLYFEIGVRYWHAQMRYALSLKDIGLAREYLDSVRFDAAVFDRVQISPAVGAPLPCRWFRPEKQAGTIFYLHGGGFAFDLASLHQLIALVAQWTGRAVFAPCYRLAPEHPFPAQREDALTAYRWLLEQEIDPARLAVAGDSAGGNLVLGLLRDLSRRGLPMPAAAVCLSPWTDLSNGGASMTANEPFDLIDRDMAQQWAAWYLQGRDPRDPEISPLHADFAGFPPLYIQAGGAEVLIDMIRAYAEKGRREGAAITLDVWEHMVHNFQAFGDRLAESEQALARIGAFLAGRLGP